MVKMSLAEYIDRKIKDVDINVDLSDYESNLRDGLMDKKSRRELYWASLDSRKILEDLESMGYPNANRLVIHLNSPENENFSGEYMKFIAWSSRRKIPNKNKIEDVITNLRSMYFINEDVSMVDINNVVEMKMSEARDMVEQVKSVIKGNIKLDSYMGSKLVVGMFKEGEAFVRINENEIRCGFSEKGTSFTFERKTFDQEANSDHAMIHECLSFGGGRWITLYFRENKRRRDVVSEMVRKTYMKQNFTRFDYELTANKPESEPGLDVWSIKVRENQVLVRNGNYRIKEHTQDLRQIKMEVEDDETGL
jgi:hypothetical protein